MIRQSIHTSAGDQNEVNTPEKNNEKTGTLITMFYCNKVFRSYTLLCYASVKKLGLHVTANFGVFILVC